MIGLQMRLPVRLHTLHVRRARWTALCQLPLKRRKDCNRHCSVAGSQAAEATVAQRLASHHLLTAGHHLLSTQQASQLSDACMFPTIWCGSSSQAEEASSM